VAAAAQAGASFIMITGFGPSDARRLQAAGRFGADLMVDVSTTDPIEAFQQATGSLADVVIDVTAKAPSALVQAIELAADGGTVVMAGTRGDVEIPGFRSDTVVRKQLRLQGTLGVDGPDATAALELLASNRFPFADLERQTTGLKGLEGLLALMAGEGEGPPPLFGYLTVPH
jgi:alcohol dehydrogenase